MSNPMETVQLVDGTGAPLGTAANPLAISGGAGSSANPYPGSDYAKDGTDGPGTNPGAGIRGWLSGIYAKLSGTLPVSIAAGQDATAGAPGDGAYAGSGSTTIIGALKGLYNAALAPIVDSPVISLSGSTTSPLSNTTYTDGAIPTSGYGSIAVGINPAQLTVYEFSFDKTTWFPAYGDSGNGTGNNTGSINWFDNTAVSRRFAVQGAYFRLRPFNAGGTTTAQVQLKAAPYAPNTMAVVQNTGSGPWLVAGFRSAGTPHSATIGTSASTPMPANASRLGWKVKNDSTGDIWINFDATATAAAGSNNIKIPAGGYLASEPGFVETGAMSVIGSAANLAITIREH